MCIRDSLGRWTGGARGSEIWTPNPQFRKIGYFTGRGKGHRQPAAPEYIAEDSADAVVFSSHAVRCRVQSSYTLRPPRWRRRRPSQAHPQQVPLPLGILMDLPVQGLPRYLPVSRTALCIHTHFDYHPHYSTGQDALIACHHNCTVHLRDGKPP